MFVGGTSRVLKRIICKLFLSTNGKVDNFKNTNDKGRYVYSKLRENNLRYVTTIKHYASNDNACMKSYFVDKYYSKTAML